MSRLSETNGIETAELFGKARAASLDFEAILSEEARNFQSIQFELGYLQASLTEKTSRYDSYLETIEAKKAAEAAEKERRARLRDMIVNNALSYIGNAYVYGGNDPNTGVDCSGFTRYILSHTAGVYLNRTAAAQSSQGRAVSAENARPGDLVFYSSGGSINHVAIYIGNGQVVHASNERVGITKSNMYYRTPAKIVNVLGD
ncbi:MAG: C40 family peptidase [Lachnospiraceae bacterium]|nr:C40 family peptidase [Lachnospiraceae bacterium]